MVLWKSSIFAASIGLLLASASAQHEHLAQQPFAHTGPSRTKPNIVFIITDDQDLHLNSLEYMPYVKKHLIDQGTFFRRHYCTVALCCPSRVNLWTGKAAHNTNVTDVNPPYGGYPKFVSQGLNEAYLPVWLQEAGYQTFYTGKLFNAHNIYNYDSPYPAGFTGSDFLLDPYTYDYLNSTFQRNKDPPVSHEGQYSTDILASKAYGFLEDATKSEKPFFLVVAPAAPHSNVKFEEGWFSGNVSGDTIQTTPPIPAKRHEHLFKDVKIPRTPSFNPDEPHGVSWVKDLPKQSQENVDFNDHFYRDRLRALQAIDEIVDGLFTRLESYGLLDNTYFFYTSDNGYHIGQHRLQPGKECGFEEDVNVPLIVRGPGIAPGRTSDIVTSHTDLAPTFLELVGSKIRDDFDGSAIPLLSCQLESGIHDRGEHVNIEYWGFALAEGNYGKKFYWNNTYKGLRLIGEDYNLYYSVWCNGEHELYDLNHDPHQTTNLYTTNHSSIFLFTPASSADPHRHPSTTITHLLARLDALILVLKTCKARSCTHPWSFLHPSGDVTDLHAALHPRFNHFYITEQRRVRFDRCEKGYILDSEGPVFEAGFVLEPRGGERWSELV